MENTRVSDPRQRNLPETGKYSMKDWADILDTTEETVREYLKKFKIRSLQIGSLRFIDAAWWWDDLMKGAENAAQRETGR